MLTFNNLKDGSSERLVESVFIIKKFDKAKVIFSGGSGLVNRPDLDHAQVAKSFYKKASNEGKGDLLISELIKE